MSSRCGPQLRDFLRTKLTKPAVMAWKYGDIREDWAEPRSYALERDGRLVAQAGI
jgi:hypothetical protein